MEELFRKSNQYLSFYDVNKLFSWKWMVVVRAMLYSFLISFILAIISIYINNENDPVSKITLYGYMAFMFLGGILLIIVDFKRDRELKKISSELPEFSERASSNPNVEIKQKILCHVFGVDGPSKLYGLSEKYSKILDIWNSNNLQFEFGIVDSYMALTKYWTFITVTFAGLFIKTNFDKITSASKGEIWGLSLLGMAFILVATFAFRGIPYLFGLFGLYRSDKDRSLQRVKYFLSELALSSAVFEVEKANKSSNRTQ